MLRSSRVPLGADLCDSFDPTPIAPGSAVPLLPIRVLIVDDHKMFANSLARQLVAEPDLEIVGCAFSARAGIRSAATTRPDVAIVDYCLPESDGASVAVDILAIAPSTQVLMLTGLQDERLLASAVDAGCSGFLTKDAEIAELVTAVRQLALGEPYIPSHLMSALLPRLATNHQDLGTDLSSREREVLELLATGAPTASIADQLFVSVTTIRNHVQRILLKLSAHSKLEAVAIAVREGVIAPPR